MRGVSPNLATLKGDSLQLELGLEVGYVLERSALDQILWRISIRCWNGRWRVRNDFDTERFQVQDSPKFFSADLADALMLELHRLWLRGVVQVEANDGIV